MQVGWEGSFFAVVLNVVTTPLRGGGPTVSPWEIVVTLYSVYLVWCWRVSAWCGGVGVVEGYCCFVVVDRFLEGRGELELVVEGVDGDE